MVKQFIIIQEKKFQNNSVDGKLLSELLKKRVVYNFRQNDLKNGGEGAPLTPIFHIFFAKKNSITSLYFKHWRNIKLYTYK